MTRYLYAIIFTCGLAFSPVSSAAIWSWIDSLTTCTANTTYCYDYVFTIASWDENDEAVNPCFGETACTLFVSHRHDSAGTSGSGVTRSWDASTYPFIVTARTMGDLGKEINAVFPLPFSSTTNHQGNSVIGEECVGIFYAAGKNLGSNDSPITNNSFLGFPLLPGSICGIAPSPSGACDFDQDVLTLDHGTLSRNELEGHEVSENVRISCTISQTLKLYIFSADNVKLRDDGSLYSELYMNDNILSNEGLILEVSAQEIVSVKSILHTNGTPEAGEFSGSTVMLITVE
ncbi:MrpH family fimbial adhesin (plasmid) [Enterobacter mori]|uniref:MrpH family fimbial adhesin n=1 Tax=Enterobacter mori TaxID=539813 RepID=UPI003F5DFA23